MPTFAAEAGALALVLAAVAYVATRNLHTYPNYDEGNYLGSLDALRHGQALGKDVFLDQPPGWYLLLVAVSYPFGNSIVGVRTGLAVVALTAVVAAYFGGRLVGGPVAGVVRAAVMAFARPFASLVATVESEPASAALAVVAVVLAAYAYRNRFRPWLAFASGAALAASAAVKLPGLTAALPIAGLAVICGSGPLARRLLLPAAGAAAVSAALVVAYHNALPQIWHGVFVTHARILNSSSATSNLYQVERYVDPRTAWGCLFICGGIASIILAIRGRERRLLAALWLWVFGGYAFVLGHASAQLPALRLSRRLDSAPRRRGPRAACRAARPQAPGGRRPRPPRRRVPRRSVRQAEERDRARRHHGAAADRLGRARTAHPHAAGTARRLRLAASSPISRIAGCRAS